MAKIKSIFEFNGYQKYLAMALPTQGEKRGSRIKLAEILGVQKGFVSAVIYGKAEFSLEHAFKASAFLSHTPEERDYFLLMLQAGRAGSKELEAYYRGKMKELLARRREIHERIGTEDMVSEANQSTYYSSWHHVAVHMCVRIPGLQTPQAISAYLGIPLPRVVEILGFLTSTGLIKVAGNSYASGPNRIHLPSDSPLISKHHINWRMQAIQSLDISRPKDLHYSSVMSISLEAVEKIREILMQSIQDMEPIIKDAKDQEVFVLGIDLFGIKR